VFEAMQKHRSFHSLMVLTHYRIVKVVLYALWGKAPALSYSELATALVKLNSTERLFATVFC